jgi:hypothetical protein
MGPREQNRLTVSSRPQEELQFMSHAKPIITALAAVVIAFPVCALASTISGGIHFSGDVTITTDVSGNGSLTFDFLPTPNNTHTFTVDNGNGVFAGLGGFGNEANFGAVSAPINTMVNIPELTFTNTPDTFVMTEVFGGIDLPNGCSDVVANAASGNTCTPPGTPFNLQDLAPNGSDSSATFVVTGYILDGGTHNPANITFTAASTGKSFEQILNDQEHGLADVITFGAQLQTLAPEPGTPSLMLGACLLLAGGMLRRRKTR